MEQSCEIHHGERALDILRQILLCVHQGGDLYDEIAAVEQCLLDAGLWFSFNDTINGESAVDHGPTRIYFPG